VNLDQRRTLRTALLRLRLRKLGRAPKNDTGGYTEVWQHTSKGKVTAVVTIEWKTEGKP
jgi:hypothetical protein